LDASGWIDAASLEPLPYTLPEPTAAAPTSTISATSPASSPGEPDAASEPEAPASAPDLQSSIGRNQATSAASNGLFSAFLGGRTMEDSSLWQTLDDQFVFGLEWMMKQPRKKFGLAVGTHFAYKRESDFNGNIDVWAVEGYLGPKLYIPLGKSPIDIYGSVGPTLLYYDVEASFFGQRRRSSDTSFAGYGTVGFMYNLNRRQAIGLEYRTVQFTDSNFFGIDGDSNYHQLTFVFSSYM
jgi:hypothetical protein